MVRMSWLFQFDLYCEGNIGVAKGACTVHKPTPGCSTRELIKPKRQAYYQTHRVISQGELVMKGQV